MTILVTGSTGTVGSQVIHHLVGRGAEVHRPMRSYRDFVAETVAGWSQS